MRKERWIQFRLEATERPRIYYEYYVTGNGVFPFDMLRFDSCWPATGEDAAKLEWQLISDRGNGLRSVKLRSYREPTIGRWTSFSWSVGTENLTNRADLWSAIRQEKTLMEKKQ